MLINLHFFYIKDKSKSIIKNLYSLSGHSRYYPLPYSISSSQDNPYHWSRSKKISSNVFYSRSK
jgi:hypothetical protein